MTLRVNRPERRFGGKTYTESVPLQRVRAYPNTRQVLEEWCFLCRCMLQTGSVFPLAAEPPLVVRLVARLAKP